MAKRPYMREALPEDAGRIREIYAPYVETTAVSFEYEVPSVEEMAARIRKVRQSYPWIVAEEDGNIVGYAYAGPFKERAAYRWSVETSVYVDGGSRRKGIGRLLLEALEERLLNQGILNMYACISFSDTEDGYLTHDSVHFHEKMGFKPVARFHQCGFKFGRWYDIVWLEKFLGEHNIDSKTSYTMPYTPSYRMGSGSYGPAEMAAMSAIQAYMVGKGCTTDAITVTAKHASECESKVKAICQERVSKLVGSEMDDICSAAGAGTFSYSYVVSKYEDDKSSSRVVDIFNYTYTWSGE